MAVYFNHEKLNVYQRSLDFIEWVTPHVEGVPGVMSLRNQLDRASTSIPLNVAEDNGKWTPKDRCRFFDNAHGSALECAAALDIAVVKKVIERDAVNDGKKILQEIVNMLIGLIKANDPGRMFNEDDNLVTYGDNIR